MNVTSNKRLLALDVMRGITIAGMILVNNPGSWGYVYSPLKHAQWNGLTPTDLKIIKRTIVIFLIGIAINWFALLCYYHDPLPFAQIRVLGVMQRLALCYGASALIALLIKHKYIPYLIVALLVGYFILLITGNGFAYNETNILSIVDRSILGDAHMYQDNHIDPEGLLSTIPSIAHVLIGFCVGKLLMEVKDIREKLERLFLIGTILTFAGFLLSYGCPLNKKIWSPTFVLVTCGLGSSFLALLVWIIDIKGYKKWSRFFESFGVNPLFIYVLADVLAILLGVITVTYQGENTSLQQVFYAGVLQPVFGNESGSLAYAILFVLLNWAIGYILYKKKIYIKI